MRSMRRQTTNAKQEQTGQTQRHSGWTFIMVLDSSRVSMSSNGTIPTVRYGDLTLLITEMT